MLSANAMAMPYCPLLVLQNGTTSLWILWVMFTCKLDSVVAHTGRRGIYCTLWRNILYFMDCNSSIRRCWPHQRKKL